MNDAFRYTGLPANVIFGSGAISFLTKEVRKLNVTRTLIVTTAFQADEAIKLQKILGEKENTIFTRAAMHTPVDVTEKALTLFNNFGADGIIALGGGSSIGLSKALALRTGAPQIVIPTTYAGSEMTTILGQTEDGKKTTQKSLKVLPNVVIYDVDYTLSLPLKMTITSGINAIAHAVEALYAENANPILALLAEEGIAKLTFALPKILKRPDDLIFRSDALQGAWLCAICLGSGGVALHHKLCHVLGGMFDLPHAETHTVILPHALAYNEPCIPKTIEVLKRAMKTDNPAAKLFDIAKQADVPTSLKELGMPQDGIEKVIQQVIENPYYNPRALKAEALSALLQNSWHGKRPK